MANGVKVVPKDRKLTLPRERKERRHVHRTQSRVRQPKARMQRGKRRKHTATPSDDADDENDESGWKKKLRAGMIVDAEDPSP